MALYQPHRDEKIDARVYADINRLVQFKHFGAQFSLHPYDRAGGLMSGRHLSHYRGRGLNFEEFRHYQPGDDIRSLDWRVTMRTREPHVRVYSEEKDLPVILMVDQRKNMFFSSQETMKSVVGAEIASLCAWQVLKDSDRVGCLVFNDHSHQWIAPQRSQKNTLSIVKSIQAFNHRLNATVAAQNSPTETFNQALHTLRKMQLKHALVIIVSDFKGFNETAKQQLQRMQAENDVMAVVVSDPLESNIDHISEFYASDGDQQVALPQGSTALQAKYESHSHEEQQKIRALFRSQSAPYVELSTDGQHMRAFQLAVGGQN